MSTCLRMMVSSALAFSFFFISVTSAEAGWFRRHRHEHHNYCPCVGIPDPVLDVCCDKTSGTWQPKQGDEDPKTCKSGHQSDVNQTCAYCNACPNPCARPPMAWMCCINGVWQPLQPGQQPGCYCA